MGQIKADSDSDCDESALLLGVDTLLDPDKIISEPPSSWLKEDGEGESQGGFRSDITGCSWESLTSLEQMAFCLCVPSSSRVQ